MISKYKRDPMYVKRDLMILCYTWDAHVHNKLAVNDFKVLLCQTFSNSALPSRHDSYIGDMTLSMYNTQIYLDILPTIQSTILKTNMGLLYMSHVFYIWVMSLIYDTSQIHFNIYVDISDHTYFYRILGGVWSRCHSCVMVMFFSL